jgi:hypothetical protein
MILILWYYKPVLNIRDVAQFGSAPALGAGCRRFKSCHPDFLFFELGIGIFRLQ